LRRYLCSLVLLSCLPVNTAWSDTWEPNLLIVDSHVDIPISLGTPAADPGQDGPMQVDIPKMRRGGVDAAFSIVYVGQGEQTAENYAEALGRAVEARFLRWLDAWPVIKRPGGSTAPACRRVRRPAPG
jgi:hypothetical protein